MADEIRKVVRKFHQHPWDINCGRCDEFADEIVARIPGALAIALGDDWAHICIRFNGFYYDAEEPYGVKHWRQLPLCVRARRK
jgi:hypothetical protein